jgi:hypothetical protein
MTYHALPVSWKAFIQGQAGMNGIVDDTLEGHEARIQQLEQQSRD